METNAIASKSILEGGFAAEVLTQFSERLAALELEKELTVLHPTWQACCGRLGCGWKGSETSHYSESMDSAYAHATEKHEGEIQGIVVLKGS
ncbi:MAG: hypothetical protein O3C02_08080 [Cyanobacteria bacterium]|jgi:hypothetical protein|nr:hypothetical protein [Cyanobacteriota bacterium]